MKSLDHVAMGRAGAGLGAELSLSDNAHRTQKIKYPDSLSLLLT